MNVASITRRAAELAGWLGDLTKTALPGELPFLAGIACPAWGAWSTTPISGVGVPQGGMCLCDRDAACAVVPRPPVVRQRPSTVEDPAYMEDPGSYSCPDVP